MFCLEDKHEVEGTRDAERHAVRERTLPEWVDEEDCRCSCNRCRISNTDPRSHAQAVGKFPLTTHIAEDTDQEVEDYQLVRTTVVQPLIERSCFPDGVEVKTNCVGRRNNCTRDDVVTVHQRTSDWFTNAIDVHWGSSDERSNETSGCCQQSWDHQHTEPTDIQTVICRRDPGTEGFPGRGALLARKSCGHCCRQKSKTIREMVELLFPRTLNEDMKDVFILPRGLGLRGVTKKGVLMSGPLPLMYL